MKHRPPPPPPPPPPLRRRSNPAVARDTSLSGPPVRQLSTRRVGDSEHRSAVNTPATTHSKAAAPDSPAGGSAEGCANSAVDWRSIPEEAFHVIVEHAERARVSRSWLVECGGAAAPRGSPSTTTTSCFRTVAAQAASNTEHQALPLPSMSDATGLLLRQWWRRQVSDLRLADDTAPVRDPADPASCVPALRAVSRDWRRMTDASVSVIRPSPTPQRTADAARSASITPTTRETRERGGCVPAPELLASWGQQFVWVDTLDLSRWPLALEDVRFRVQALALRHLTTLTVAGKNDLSDEELATFGNLPKLKCLSLNHCNKVSDAGVSCLAAVLPDLELLELAYCRCLTDNALRSITTLASLRSLSLKSSIGITDAGLQELASLQQLTALDLTFCYRISDWGISSLRSLTRLQKLNLTDCTNCTDAALAALHPLSSLHSLVVQGCHSLSRPAQVAAKYAPGGLLQLHLWRQKQRSTPYNRPQSHIERRHALLLEIRSFRPRQHLGRIHAVN